jgi:Uma2 family endonuclease
MQSRALLINRHDYQFTPDGPPYFQVIEGELIQSPSLKVFHQEIVGNIAYRIGKFLATRSIGTIHIGPLDVYLGDINVYQPDVFFISRQRGSIITEKGIEGAPDLVVEVLSAATARYDKISKRKIYARFGVREFWLVDPDTRTIQVYLLDKNADAPAATCGDQNILTSTVLAGLRLKTAAVFKSTVRK